MYKNFKMNRFLSLSKILLLVATLIYALVSKSIFDNVYITSKQVVDEEFHIPQGLAYCNLDFDEWNPKITTLPGLYLVSMVFLAPFNLCRIYWLRFVNLAASVLNVLLFYNLLGLYNKHEVAWKKIFSSINLSLLPPLYFFSHFYYTDTLSMTFVLLMLTFEKWNNHTAAAISGMASVLMRQTNITWVVMMFGKYVVVHGVNNALKKKLKKNADHRISEKDLLEFKSKRITIKHLNLSSEEWADITGYLTILFVFALFGYCNDGIVVGDRTAHVPTVHIPQIFYFSLFVCVFMWPYFLPKLMDFIQAAFQWKFITAFIFTVFSIIVYYNTLVHPYLLADNRHYSFYIWHRIYGTHFFSRYAMIVCYVFAMYCIWSIIYNSQDISHALVCIPCTLLVLIPEGMIEIRYFLIPYVLLRLMVRDVSLKQLICEFFSFLVINYLTLNVFFTKNIYWMDYSQPQKLIW